MQIVGVVLVRNEDVFIEQAIRNVVDFCDRIYVVDHLSTDRTWDIVSALAREYDHLDARRARHARVSHELIEPYAGTDTWVLGVDGDELYDPGRLAGFRDELRAGTYRHVFRIASNVLNCVELDRERGLAAGYLSPPCRSIVKLYNFAALRTWTGCQERLHAGTIVFRDGYDERCIENLGERLSWEESPLRCLHVCFLPRSSAEAGGWEGRPSITELAAYRRGLVGELRRRVRWALGIGPGRLSSSPWKNEKYRRGELVTKDVTAFFPALRSGESLPARSAR